MHFALISHDNYWFGKQHPRYAQEGYHHKKHLEPLLRTELQHLINYYRLDT
jgi:hypothetical protein